MDKKNYYEIELKNLQNGYTVTARYKELIDPEKKDRYDRYNYEYDSFVFTTWDQVVEFVTNNALEVPPKQV